MPNPITAALQPDAPAELRAVARALVRAAINETDGNLQKMAPMLGYSETALKSLRAAIAADPELAELREQRVKARPPGMSRTAQWRRGVRKERPAEYTKSEAQRAKEAARKRAKRAQQKATKGD